MKQAKECVDMALTAVDAARDELHDLNIDLLVLRSAADNLTQALTMLNQPPDDEEDQP